nr:hypothetical protein [Actinomadura madurae]
MPAVPAAIRTALTRIPRDGAAAAASSPARSGPATNTSSSETVSRL